MNGKNVGKLCVRDLHPGRTPLNFSFTLLNSLNTAFLNPINCSKRLWAVHFNRTRASFRYLWLILFCLAFSGLQAQLSGVINDYAVVTSVDFCNNLVVVNDDAGFFEGDRVILMQMQGAAVDTSNTSNYGQITDIGNAGHFEILTILDISANIISFEEAMIHEYAGPGVQLITLPQYNDVSVDMTLQPLLWDGLQGGVLAMEVTGTLTLNADIDASGHGFRGAGGNNDPACTSFSGYKCELADGCGGRKGEGVFVLDNFILGKGAPANGGGGGNDSDAGGGGGSNIVAGGQGGARVTINAGDCPGDDPGLGGYALPFDAADPRLFMGGGGGAGDWNDNDGETGGHGGGIIIILADNIDGNGFGVFANGLKALQSRLDGGAGGGAGGSVFLDVNNFLSPIQVEARGGGGGDVDNGNDPDLCVGPGGGGSGGLVAFAGAVPGALSPVVDAGDAGSTLNANAPPACAGSSNGALAGVDGSIEANLSIPQSTLIYEDLEVYVSPDTLLCFGTVGTIGVDSAFGTGTITYSWNTSDSTQFIDIDPDIGTTIYTVTVSDERGCAIVEQIEVEVNKLISAERQPDGLLAPGQSAQLIADPDPLFVSYSWSPGTDLSSTSGSNVIANAFETTTYCVTAVDSNGCASTACVEVLVDKLINIPNAFSPNGDGLNDIFRVPPDAPCQELAYFQIFNRWGDKVFEGFDLGVGWDGTWRGKEQEAGTYVYRIGLICDEFNSKDFSGTVTLIR